ncbi:prolyl 3-hydroxylase 1-like [Phlebotomus argentipes]|uniref:prolyl 3-hydroxylase 1-like n=1 Tax=Phlebotomus argentipes TaxID=94469 RepID=UPI0028932E1F|nr:prolyl 3-hydroxylase 1-like [Phlebotomus argentipes]
MIIREILLVLLARSTLGHLTTNRLDYVINEVFLSVPEKPDEVPNHPEQVKTDGGTFVEYYLVGNNAYLHNDWLGCAYFFEKAVQEFRDYSGVVANCRINCEYERQNGEPLFPENPENIHFFDGIMRKTLCLKKCLFRDLAKAYRFFEVDDAFREIFHSRKPYEYLQLCHFKNGDLQKAVSAAATVLAMHPEHKLSVGNLKYYSTLEEFRPEFLKDEEKKRFVDSYLKGMDFYRESKWQNCIDEFEKSLMTFDQEENICRAFCEGSFNQGWHPDFTTSTANHFTYCLRCKRNCTKDMSIVGTQKYPDVFPSHYEYLQFSYFNVGNLEQAIKCTMTYLLFFPENEVMLENLEFYKNHPEAKEEFFAVRKEALEYYQRSRYEKTLLQFINEEFTKFFEKQKANS